jgi:hypothetical protein
MHYGRSNGAREMLGGVSASVMRRHERVGRPTPIHPGRSRLSRAFYSKRDVLALMKYPGRSLETGEFRYPDD